MLFKIRPWLLQVTLTSLSLSALNLSWILLIWYSLQLPFSSPLLTAVPMIAFKFLRVFLSLFLVLHGTQAQFDTPPTNLTTGFVRFPHATRQISWIYSPNGVVVYDGDIVFGTIAEFNDALVNITHSPNDSTLSSGNDIPSRGLSKRAYSAFPGSSSFWPSGIIYWRYLDSVVESIASADVNFAISTWTAAVPCIRFVQLPNDNKPGGANGIVTIVTLPKGAGYCSAPLGYTPTAMWLEVDPSGCGGSTMLHEFGMWNSYSVWMRFESSPINFIFYRPPFGLVSRTVTSRPRHARHIQLQ